MARNLTPLAVAEITSHPQISRAINVFYVSIENALANLVFNPLDANLVDIQSNGSFPIAPNSRTLTVAQTKLTPLSTSFSSNSSLLFTVAEIVLIYEAPNTNITTLYGSLSYDFREVGLTWAWQNISDAVYSTIRDKSNTWLSPPIAARTMTEETSLQDPQSLSTHVCIAYFNPNSLSDASANPVYLATFDDWSSPGE